MEFFTGEGSNARVEQTSVTLSPDEAKRTNQFEVLIMSEAGKPIYSYSKREDSVTLMPLCCSLLSYAKKAQKENLNIIKTSENLIINFSTRSPLIILLIYYGNGYIEPVILIDQIEAQIKSILTAKTLRSVFEERPTYDLRKLIYGSEKLLDSILNINAQLAQPDLPRVQGYISLTSQTANSTFNSNSPGAQPTKNDTNPQPSSSGTASAPVGRPQGLLIPIVAMPSNSRDSFNQILSKVISGNCKNVVFSLLFKVIGPKGYRIQELSQETDLDREDSLECSEMIENMNINSDNTKQDVNFQLITVCNHHNRHKLVLADIHLIHSLLNGIRSQLETVDFLWMPVCLPRFNEDAFLHTYMAFTNRRSNSLVIFSVDREEFANCQQAKTIIEERIDKLKINEV